MHDEIKKKNRLEEVEHAKPPSWVRPTDKWPDIKYKNNDEKKDIGDYGVERLLNMLESKIEPNTSQNIKDSIPSKYSDSKLGLLKRCKTGESAIEVLRNINIKEDEIIEITDSNDKKRYKIKELVNQRYTAGHIEDLYNSFVKEKGGYKQYQAWMSETLAFSIDEGPHPGLQEMNPKMRASRIDKAPTEIESNTTSEILDGMPIDNFLAIYAPDLTHLAGNITSKAWHENNKKQNAELGKAMYDLANEIKEARTDLTNKRTQSYYNRLKNIKNLANQHSSTTQYWRDIVHLAQKANTEPESILGQNILDTFLL